MKAAAFLNNYHTNHNLISINSLINKQRKIMEKIYNGNIHNYKPSMKSNIGWSQQRAPFNKKYEVIITRDEMCERVCMLEKQ